MLDIVDCMINLLTWLMKRSSQWTYFATDPVIFAVSNAQSDLAIVHLNHQKSEIGKEKNGFYIMWNLSFPDC